MIRRVIIETIICAVIVLFTYAAVSKFLEFHKFKVELGKSPIFSSYAVYVAIGVPCIEIILSIALAFDRFRLLALFCAYVLMVLFTTYIVTILNFSDYIPCSCGGIIQDMTWNQHLVFNSFFIVFIAINILIYPETKQRESRKPGRVGIE